MHWNWFTFIIKGILQTQKNKNLSYVLAGGDLIQNSAPWMPNRYNSFRPHYGVWMHYEKVQDRLCWHHDQWHLSVCLLYNVPKLGVVNIPNPDEQYLAQSIANLSLNPQDNYDTLGNNQAFQENA